MLASPLGGCSFMFVDGPPPQYEHRRSAAADPVPCTTSAGWPVVDLLWTGFQAFRFVNGVTTDEDRLSDEQKSARSLQIAGSLIFGLVFAISAGVGFSRVSDCKEINADFLGPSPGTRSYGPAAPRLRPQAELPATPGWVPPPAPPARPAPRDPPAPAAPPATPAIDGENPAPRRRAPPAGPPPPAAAPPPTSPAPDSAPLPPPPVPAPPAAPPARAPWQSPSTPSRG